MAWQIIRLNFTTSPRAFPPMWSDIGKVHLVLLLVCTALLMTWPYSDALPLHALQIMHINLLHRTALQCTMHMICTVNVVKFRGPYSLFPTSPPQWSRHSHCWPQDVHDIHCTAYSCTALSWNLMQFTALHGTAFQWTALLLYTKPQTSTHIWDSSDIFLCLSQERCKEWCNGADFYTSKLQYSI